jgi:hypothetical protein
MRMDGSSASTATPGFGRPKVAASAVNEDVVAVVQARFWKEPPRGR